MADGMNKPAIRFAGFTDAWEQRKLGELVDRVVRKNTNNESTLPLTISAQYGLVDQITYFNNRVASRDVSNYYLVLNGEFAYNKSTSDGYPFGAVKRLDLYEKGVLSTLYIVFSPKKEQQIDSDFLTVFFDTDRWHKGVAERAAEGARNHGLLNISAEDFFDIDLSIPKDVAEQKQIGAFIRQLDNLITLHQRKYFYKLTSAGTTRTFQNTNAWEQRKLGELSNIIDPHPSHRAPEEEEIGIPFVGIGDVDIDGNINYEKVRKVNESIYDEHHRRYDLAIPSLGIGRVASLGKVIRLRDDIGKYAVSPTMSIMQFTENSNIDFLYAAMNTEMFQRQFALQSNGSTRQSVGIQDLRVTEVSISPNGEEQKEIGAYFRNLDNLITLHQRERILHEIQNN